MVAPRVKFRCFHCNRLLSAPANRIGRAVACPKCVQAVIVPTIGEGSEPESNTEPPGKGSQEALRVRSSTGTERSSRDDLPPFMSEIAAAIPDDVLNIQPEDIRAEIPLIEINVTSNNRPEFSEESAVPEDSSLSSEFDSGDVVEDEAEPPVPPLLHIETVSTPSLVSDPPVRRSGDLILPASVVLAWSLFVLFAQALAFLAGLLIGHYHWKNP